MRFREKNNVWDKIPQWVESMIRFGYEWQKQEKNSRRIALLSFPCDTESAALIALGALRYDLERADTNILDDHFKLIKKNYYKNMNNMLEDNKWWDLRNVESGECFKFESYDTATDSFKVVDSKYKFKIKSKGRIIKNPNGPLKLEIFRENSHRYQINGYPVPFLGKGGVSKLSHLNINLPGCTGKILEKNLDISYYGLVLIGRGTSNDSNYYKRLGDISFIKDDYQYSLKNLLLIDGNINEDIRRLNFLSKFKEVEWEKSIGAKLVIVDNIIALEAADEFFPESDIIVTFNRAGSEESIEMIRNWILQKQRYYCDIESENAIFFSQSILLRLLARK